MKGTKCLLYRAKEAKTASRGGSLTRASSQETSRATRIAAPLTAARTWFGARAEARIPTPREAEPRSSSPR